ncbi:MAG: PEP-CTERM sorting domain-containing protein [Burkholderiaceae bacterium]|nr:PEP-CTERM sorting domain-containing protein [Burkholderiaceae bacterium]
MDDDASWPAGPSPVPRAGQALASRVARSLAVFAAVSIAAAPAAAASFAIPASDAGFVTVAGGSAKGDSTLAPAAKYNYSVGFELHYAAGDLSPPPFAPMLRKNYFVFDLSAVTEPIASAKLVLWTGTLETADPSETYLLKESTDMPAVLGLATAVASGTSTSDYDDPGDALVTAAATLYGKLGDGAMVLGGTVLTKAMDDSFVEIVLSPSAVGYLTGFAGGKLLLAGLVPSVDGAPPAFPQQPFGFTGPDIPGGDPLTPMLLVTTVPEPAAGWLILAGGLALAGLRRRR